MTEVKTEVILDAKNSVKGDASKNSGCVEGMVKEPIWTYQRQCSVGNT